MSRITLRERFFPLHQPDDADRFLERFPWSVTLEPYRALLSQFLQGQLPDERFQWRYRDRLAKEALWRDDETFALLNSLFENEWGREGAA